MVSTPPLGYGVDRAVHMCNLTENLNPENRDRLVRFLSCQLDRLLGYRREYREGKRVAVLSYYTASVEMVGG